MTPEVQSLAARRAAVACLLGLLIAGGSALAMNPANGNRIYNTYCIGCHGIGGKPVMPQVPVIAGSPQLAQPDFVLLNTIKFGKNAMPPFQAMLSEQDIYDVIAYLRTLR